MRHCSLVVVLVAVILAAPGLAQEEEQDRERSLSCTLTEQSNGGMAMSCLPDPEPEHDIRIDAVRWTSYSIEIEVTALQRSIERLALRLTTSCDSDVSQQLIETSYDPIPVGTFGELTALHDCSGDPNSVEVQPKWADWTCEACGTWTSQ